VTFETPSGTEELEVLGVRAAHRLPMADDTTTPVALHVNIALLSIGAAAFVDLRADRSATRREVGPPNPRSVRPERYRLISVSSGRPVWRILRADRDRFDDNE
jgi:hypothetical protein